VAVARRIYRRREQTSRLFGADFPRWMGPTVPAELSGPMIAPSGPDAPRAGYVGPRRSLTGSNSDQWVRGHRVLTSRLLARLASVSAKAGRGNRFAPRRRRGRTCRDAQRARE